MEIKEKIKEITQQHDDGCITDHDMISKIAYLLMTETTIFNE